MFVCKWINMWNNKTKKIKMLNMRNRVLLYVVHFVICFFVHENGNVDIIAEYRDYSILTKMVLYYSLWEIYFVFFDPYSGDRTALVQFKLSLNGFKTYIQIINKWYNAWIDDCSSSRTTQTNLYSRKFCHCLLTIMVPCSSFVKHKHECFAEGPRPGFHANRNRLGGSKSSKKVCKN